MMELIQQTMYEFSNGPYYIPFLVMLGMVLNNLVTYKLMKRDHAKELDMLMQTQRAERRRSTETINALRGIIWAFKDSLDQEEEQNEEIPPYQLPHSNI